MNKKGKIRSYVKVLGEGNVCPKCKISMERRKRTKPPTNGKSYFYTEWDYCPKCSHVQHYEQYKSGVWQEAETQASFFKSI